MDALRAKARDIRLLVLDVDGVLTDGRLFFGPDGEALKIFHVRDGAGLVAARRAGLELAIISGRDSAAVAHRARELGIARVHQGVADKGRVFDALCAELGVRAGDCACVGDDTPDLPLFERAGLSFAVADAHPAVRARADWVTTLPGGQGAVREVCDLLLGSRA